MENITANTDLVARGLSKPMTLVMAVVAGLAVANIYYNQPMLGLMASDFPGSGVAGLIPTVTLLGYALGLFLLVPLGDIIERRRLIVIQFFLLAIALAITAMAPSVFILVIASVLVGASATVAQQIVPFAVHLAPSEKRGAVVGTVLAGILGGILLSRSLAGFIADMSGWREMFWLAAPLAIIGAMTMALTLPHSKPDTKLRYLQLLKSLTNLWMDFAELRWAAITQAILFAAFSAFWTVLALLLEQPAYNMGPAEAGLFGIVGLAGILAAPIAGRIADAKGPHSIVITGTIVTLFSWIVFGVWPTIPGLIAGVLLLDFGVQSALVSNQHIIYALKPEARARLNTIFIGSMFLGGATGAAMATTAWNVGGWIGVSALGTVLALLALAAQIRALKIRTSKQR
ncbi:MFS transporter [Thalassospira xiamenensis]|uniref:Predicted arabinose efflux permease, MFS family n=1 Tax=Thalassospira xiamenensis TaxID=220697 RepID=A0A285TDP9_9PROT|nr:MFS transporter [Thalassospira xiamenensis]SOC20335.1 Predicted arabinose efflux permease, MFS family [Thalassospira xiamenensis]